MSSHPSPETLARLEELANDGVDRRPLLEGPDACPSEDLVVDGDRPTGMVTDRDIVTRAVAQGIPADARVDSVMSMDLVTVGPDADVRGALHPRPGGGDEGDVRLTD